MNYELRIIMKKIVLFIAVFLPAIVFNGCKEDPVERTMLDKTIPGQVQNPVLQTLPGGARITYSLPDDKDLMYVKAVYTLNGVEKNATAAIYDKYLEVAGFGTTDEQTIRLYCVDMAENHSAPVILKFRPDTPPIRQIEETIRMQAIFGGIQINWENLKNAQISMYFLAADSVGDLFTADVLYTSIKDGEFKLRGFPAEKRRFGVYVRDRWDNRSDTTWGELTPYFEKELDRNKFKRYILPGDNDTDFAGVLTFDKLWDGQNGENTETYWHTSIGRDPMLFTIDLGTEAKMSRYTLWHRLNYEYKQYCPKRWKVYGTNKIKPETAENYWKAAEGGWKTDWTLLVDCYSFKPSGEFNDITQEDRDYGKAGFEFDMPLDAPPVRYLRFHVTETWSGSTMLHFGELKFWGEEIKI
jgi:hypothetical protein